MCESSVPVDGTPELSGLLAFDEYLKLFKLICTLQIRFSLQIQEDNKVARRAALAEDDKQAFAATTSKQIDLSNKIKNGVHLCVLEYYQIEPELYDRTGGCLMGQEATG